VIFYASPGEKWGKAKQIKVFTDKVFLEDRSSRVIISTYCRQNQGFASYKGIHREGTFEGKRLTADNFNIL